LFASETWAIFAVSRFVWCTKRFSRAMPKFLMENNVQVQDRHGPTFFFFWFLFFVRNLSFTFEHWTYEPRMRTGVTFSCSEQFANKSAVACRSISKDRRPAYATPNTGVQEHKRPHSWRRHIYVEQRRRNNTL
jgi:hypothetical protein